MSDSEEYEYEYDEDASDGAGGSEDDQDMEDNFEYTDEEEEADDAEVALENAYYNAKGLRDSSDSTPSEILEAFQEVVELETKQQAEEQDNDDDDGDKSTMKIWSYKARKQLVKYYLRIGNSQEMMKQYSLLLDIIASGAVSPNAIEKGINGMLERVSSLYQGSDSNSRSTTVTDKVALDPKVVARNVYDATLQIFHPKIGTSPNERLWFKTNLKYGQLLYEMNETTKLQLVLRDLKHYQQQESNDAGEGSSSSTTTSSTNLMEIYALQIQLYSKQKDNKKLRDVFQKAMSVRGGIPHPRTLALIQELGGKMHMASREYSEATSTFFQAFKSYDEAGDPSRLRCLKYLVMASMLHASTINPFDSQEARPYRDDPEIVAMTNLVHAFHNNEIQTFESILTKQKSRFMQDEFVREHVEDLLRTIRTQVLRRVIRPYTRISLQAISHELNDIPVQDVENLLVSLILDGTLQGGQIDQVHGVLIKDKEIGQGANKNDTKNNSNSSTSGGGGGGDNSTGATKMNQSTSTSKTLGGTSVSSKSTNPKLHSMEELANALETLVSSISNTRVKEQHHGSHHHMRGVH